MRGKGRATRRGWRRRTRSSGIGGGGEAGGTGRARSGGRGGAAAAWPELGQIGTTEAGFNAPGKAGGAAAGERGDAVRDAATAEVLEEESSGSLHCKSNP